MPIQLTLSAVNIMYQYIVQFRQVYVATTQINSTIYHIFLSCQPLVAPQNFSPTQTCNPICHRHKTFNFSEKGIVSFNVENLQMKLELKDSRNGHWWNFELQKSWLEYSIFVSFLVLSVCKNRFLLSYVFVSGSGLGF